MTDISAWELLTLLAASLEVEIEAAPLDPFCFVGILPGGSVAYDYCDECGSSCGAAWVRLASIREEPSQIGDGWSSCASEFVVNIEAGMIRCHQTVNEDGTPASVQYQHNATQAQMAEMETLKRVLLCTVIPSNPERLMGVYTPIGPEGGCVGGAWTAQFQMF